MTRIEIVEVEKIFDLILYIIIGALIVGRFLYVLENPNDFQMKIDRILHIYKYPGFNFWGICVGFALTMIVYIKNIKINKMRLLDLLAIAFSLFLSFVFLSFLFSGTYVGISMQSVGFNFVGYIGRRLPIQLFAAVLFFIFYLYAKSRISKKNNGFIYWVFLSYTFLIFLALEFFRRDKIYFEGILINKFIYFAVALFCSIVVLLKYKSVIKTEIGLLIHKKI
jgi:phosphatidylglycerol:prolipoprotein diacylglycerol transferase